MYKVFKTIAAISMVAGLTVSANATGPSEIVVDKQGVRSVVVGYDDLNLETTAGQDALASRIRAAVRQVCNHNNGRQTLSEINVYRQCANEATQNAIASVATNSPVRIALGF